MFLKKYFLYGIIAILLVGCSSGGSSSPSYEETKKQVIDVLQTEDGKKVLREILKDQNFRDLLVFQHDEVQTAMETTLLSEKAEQFWKDVFDENPKMKEAFAKSMNEEMKNLQTQLLQDAKYQEQLIKFFDQPDMQKQLESILKGTTIRKEIEKVVEETIENPMMQSKWQELIRKSGGESESKGGEEGGKKEEKKEEKQ